ncbi:hypothetical protein JG687_00001851 [Phytophthora cactorum]|uniref:ZSWIM1/3 RNaseH-like domain-containing protein n=1 Tax=Phytophthora cactorum TaxID=29920 RepID=A0A8T1UX09_9STRA|nr:hypothetical protein JG687_00001851 [Phytophthora cactorum]
MHDIFGHARAVLQLALMENESLECLENAVISFKPFNSTWDNVRVDKDFGEIALLREEFPDATIPCCNNSLVCSMS